jgi:VWFA-related protein
MKRATRLFAAAFAIAAIASAQQGYFETFEVRLHNLDVVVTDANGNPVRGLTQEDFLVFENDTPQSITNFSTYESPGVRGPQLPLSQDPSAQEHTKAAAAATALQAEPRRIVFFVDDMGVRKRARTTLIRDATALVDQFAPGDLLSVVRPTGAKRIVQPFTTDTAAVRTALTDAIESCKFNLRSSGQYEIEDLVNGLEDAEAEGDRQFARGQYALRVGDRVQQRLGQLRALIGSMAGVEGRKVIVLITSGLPSIPGRSAGMDPMRFGPNGDPKRVALDRPVTEWGQVGDLNPLIDELARTAAANGVTIYALEPEVPLDVAVRRVTAGSKSASSAELEDHARAEVIVPVDMFGEMMHYRAQTLRSLSERTGGRWFRGVGTIDDVFRQVANDLSVYYSLAYRATGAPDKPRRVEVKIRNRPDLIVRTRTEVIDRSPEREMGDLVAATLLYPRDANELRIALQTGTQSRKGRTVTVPLDVVIPLDALTFLPARGDKYAAAIDIHYAIAGIRTSFMTSGRQQQAIEISKQQYNARVGTNYRFKTGVEVWPGPTRIAIGVLDPASRLTGFRTLEVLAK